MDYEELIGLIFKRFPSVQGAGFTPGSYKPGLERMRAFDEALGFPSRKLRTIHVAGTNGKGSVASMLASALSACGYRAGLFTSPHLMDFRERIQIAESGTIPREAVFSFLSRWLPWIEEHDLSFFEITTGLAFQWFLDQGVDVAVVETGLGGRLDATNILPAPELGVISSIGLDHMALLGDTRAQIAAQKAGIFKADVPVVIGEKDAETAPVFEEAAQGLCPLHFADETTPPLWERHEDILAKMDLQADVQEKNLRTVLCGVALLKGRFGRLRNTDAVVEGITHAARRTAFRGRWERLGERPCVLADIGHNAQALAPNFARLDRMYASGDFSSLVIVYGIMADKDLDAILPLMPVDATYIFTAPRTPRALPAPELLNRFAAYRRSRNLPARACLTDSVSQAVQQAIREPSSLVYIGGSAFVVAEALTVFET